MCVCVCHFDRVCRMTGEEVRAPAHIHAAAAAASARQTSCQLVIRLKC